MSQYYFALAGDSRHSRMPAWGGTRSPSEQNQWPNGCRHTLLVSNGMSSAYAARTGRERMCPGDMCPQRCNWRRGLAGSWLTDQFSAHWCKAEVYQRAGPVAEVYLDAAVLVDRFAILLIVSLSLMMPSRSRLAFSRSAASLGELRRKTGLPRKLLIKRLSSGSLDAR